MKSTKRQVTARVFKKLSALRATLSNEERAILDNLIVVDEEVTAHKMKASAVSKALSKNTARAAEATAHKMKASAVSKALSKNAAKAAEATAHKMRVSAASKAVDKAKSKAAFRIAFDPNSEEYKIQE